MDFRSIGTVVGDRDCRRLMEWKPNGTMRLHPFELIQQEPGIHVRYHNDWHIGAMPERYTYDKTGQKQPLNELALDLAPGEYGRAVCNGSASMGELSAMGGSGTGIQESGIMYWIF